jgi:DNA-binding YbaB/EbfC family protein
MKNFGKLMKQAQEMQERVKEMQAKLEAERAEGSAGGGMVVVTMNGRHEIVGVKIDPEVVVPDDVEMLEDLITAACNDARTKIDEKVQEEMGRLSGGLGLPPGLI